MTEERAHKATDKRLAKIEQRLAGIYDRAEQELEAKADKYFSQFAEADEKKLKLVEQGKLGEKEYTAWRKRQMLTGERYTRLKEQIAAEYVNINQTALSYINDELPEVYSINYNALEDKVDGVGGYSFELVDADTVRNLAIKDDTLLPTKDLDIPKDMAWSTKKINAELLQGILQGEKITDIAKRLETVTGMEKVAALRNARTMFTAAQNKGRLDSYARATADGIILQKEWLSADQPGRTRQWHLELDGQKRDYDEPFHNSVGDIMYPGDPSADGENVYNCRCTMVAVVKGFKKV
jgi:hypothetical protein